MTYWLCRERRGQHGDWLQRFDPRFWTVNFPRPMMASVVTTGPDALRVDCEFHHAGELAGLIWDSVDRLDHPLLAYATDRDYARTTLRFRWRSGGLVPLDAPHGPTLTIEGEDAAGNARSWYVRLWNYAQGTPEDAVITLPFSGLADGFAPGGEAVHPSRIARMFISLCPPGYVEGSTAPLTTRADGWAELSDISCDGERAMLALGDVLLPPHGEQLATAYDDCFNQTPARLLRQVRGLGYRGRIVHYLGMSHFFRLVPGEGRLLAAGDGALAGPALAWHHAFFAECAGRGFEAIASLSYELLAQHCPDAWQQRAADGTPARTGWEPPSALLSPAHAGAMDWLKQVAARFVALIEEAGLPVRFQIGEPWWWVTADGHICLYDAAAKAALGGNPRVIADMRTPQGPQARALLGMAGSLLAASTAGLAAAIRAAASGPAEVLLLAFTPTVLDPAMPDLKRANLPLEWAHPAFDRLQLEDYDWLTAGKQALRRAALAEVDARLGYPPEKQDYFAGFVLRGEDAETYWPRIDAALDEARARGIGQRFVWALPQIARDGYTRLAPPPQESAVQPFDDVPYPLALGRDTAVSPEFSTMVATTASGHERRNALWSDARLRFDVGPGIRAESELGTLIAFFRARRGPARGFRLRDPFDHSSAGMTGVPGPHDQLLGTGDGARADFALVKRYGEEGEPQIRPITRPAPGSVLVAVDGIATTAFALREGGIIALAAAPPAGAEVTAGFLFDVPVRFAEDRLDVAGVNFAAGEAPSVPLVELRETTAEPAP